MFPRVREATLVIGLEWVIFGFRQACFVRAPADASAHADLTAPAAAVAAADPDAVDAAVAATAHSSASITRTFAAVIVLVAASFVARGYTRIQAGLLQVRIDLLFSFSPQNKPDK